MVKRLPAAAIAAFVLLLASAARAEWPHDRTGFMIGFNLGYGNAGIDVEGADTDREGSGAGNLRLGWAVRPDLVLGLETSAWTKTYEDAISSIDLTWTFANADAAITWYPANMGLYLRAGVGIASAEVELAQDNLKVTADAAGLSLLGAIGYEFRLTRKLALGPQFEYSFQNLDDEDLGIKSTNFFSITVGLDWYW
jgi:hypothetical protein